MPHSYKNEVDTQGGGSRHWALYYDERVRCFIAHLIIALVSIAINALAVWAVCLDLHFDIHQNSIILSAGGIQSSYCSWSSVEGTNPTFFKPTFRAYLHVNVELYLMKICERTEILVYVERDNAIFNLCRSWFNFISIVNNPVDTQRRFNVFTTPRWRRFNVKTMLCAHWNNV